MTNPGPDAAARAAALYDAYLQSEANGAGPDFAALCAAHPDFEGELRALHGACRLLDDLLPGPLTTEDDGSAATPAEPGDLLQRLQRAGARWERYRVQEEIGRGGMGVLHRAWDLELRRPLAIKLLRPRGEVGDVEARDRGLARFLEEAQVTGQLDHPGIVNVHELGVAPDGRVFFTMTLVRGQDLRTVFARVRTGADGWTQVRALGALLKVCEAMSYAHSRGVIHRDLKPANVMVGEFGQVYVMDWGLARLHGRVDGNVERLRQSRPADPVSSERADVRAQAYESPLVTVDGESVGTPVYMAPEQARGEVERVAPGVDVYAVGAMLYQLLSGDAPFAAELVGATPRQVLARVVAGPPRPLRDYGHAVSAEAASICERAMAREPAARYPDMAALAADLRAFLENRVVRAHATGGWAETRKWIRRNRLAAGLLAVAVALVVGSGFLIRERLDAREHARIRAGHHDVEEFRTWSADFQAASQPGPPILGEWLARARSLLADLPYQEARMELPSAAALAAARATFHPDHELTHREADLEWRDRMLGRKEWPTAATARAEVERVLATMALPRDLGRLNSVAFRMVRPDEPRRPGHERTALMLAERLVEAAAADPTAPPEFRGRVHPRYRDTLATAQWYCGQFEAALASQRQALAGPFWDNGGAAEVWRVDVTNTLSFLERSTKLWQGDTAGHQRDRLAHTLDLLQLELAAYAWRRAGESMREDRVRLVAALRHLQHQIVWAEQAASIGSLGGAWSETIAAIRAAPVYGGLEVSPQVGLVPLGQDPASGLFEFADLFTGEPPARVGGRLDIGSESGLVFVLLPGGSVPLAPGAAREPMHERVLAPFFTSKYEVTDHQIFALGGRGLDLLMVAVERRARAATLLPWDYCVERLGQAGNWLRLPSGVEWEYGCRAGTTTRWWTGDDPASVDRAGLVAPSSPSRVQVPQEVGQRDANPFGLHDVHGNVAEWCLEGRPTEDGVSLFADARMVRGGSYGWTAETAASGLSAYVPRSTGGEPIGMRPVRCLTR